MATYAALAEAPLSSGARSATGVVIPRRSPVPGTFPTERALPVLPELAGLFPGGGLPRGGTVLLGPTAESFPGLQATGSSSLATVRLPGLTSLLLCLLAGTSSGGYWCAVVGLPALGLAAAAELGVDLGHLVLVPRPGSEGCWQSVVATLLETVDLVCLAPGAPVRPADARRLAARARERCSTLLVLDGASAPTGAPRELSPGPARPGRVVACWPGPSDLRCAVRTSSWSGLGHGHGLLSSRQLEAEVGGRGAASRPRRGQLRLPV
jgi:hypothetical protein